MKAGDLVQVKGAGQAVVHAVHGDHVDVVGPEGLRTVHVDDLTADSSPGDALQAGSLGNGTEYALRLQALFLKHAYRSDPRAGLSNARVEPKLHQIFVAHLVTGKIQPRMILADEVGLGKTIEAGLILKELRARRQIERVLVVCPASLQVQWQTELRSKFNERFEVLDGAAAKYHGRGGRNPFASLDNVICSLPFAANVKRSEQIVDAGWDLVVFDEAHRVRRWRQSASSFRTTKAYELADELKDVVPGLLLLTATPMQLHPFELYSLIELIEPGVYSSFEDYDRRRRQLPALNDLMRLLNVWSTLDAFERAEALEQHRSLLERVGVVDGAVLGDPGARAMCMDAVQAEHPLAGMLVRNRKSEIGGFTPRQAHRVLVDLDTEEAALYEDVTDYIRTGYDQAREAKQNAVGFLMVTYQKMLASSSFAIRQSLLRRVEKLARQLEGSDRRRSKRLGSLDQATDVAEISSSLADLEALALDPDRLESEIAELQGLIDRLGRSEDSKVAALLDALDAIFEEHPDEKVVIFTQFIETQTYLAAQIEHAGHRTATFNGSMSLDAKEAAIREFRLKARVLVSTESGGEGRNLQFAHLLVNYDHPWNPMKVEQRIGRLDRIGQKRPVYIYNLACRGTVEERVLDVLEHRIGLFAESVGSLDPILGEVEDDLEDLIMRQRGDFDSVYKDFAEDLGKKVREAQEGERLYADLALDRASFRRDRANELLGLRPLATHHDLEGYAGRALDHFGGTLMPHTEGGVVINLSPRLASRMSEKTGQRRGVFDPDLALELEHLSFFAMGNRLVDAIVDLPLAPGAPTTGGRRLPGDRSGSIVEVYYEIDAGEHQGAGRVIRHVLDGSGKIRREEVRSMPQLGEAIRTPTVPDWVSDEMSLSRDAFNHELGEVRAVVAELDAARRSEERAREHRIHDYRRARLLKRIDDLSEWVEEKRIRGSDRDRKILPAQEGRLRKAQEDLAELDAEFEEVLRRLNRPRDAVNGRMWAAGVVEVVA